MLVHPLPMKIRERLDCDVTIKLCHTFTWHHNHVGSPLKPLPMKIRERLDCDVTINLCHTFTWHHSHVGSPLKPLPIKIRERLDCDVTINWCHTYTWHNSHVGSHHHLIYPLTTRVVRAPQMTSQPVSSILPCSPLLSGIWRTPGLSIPWCCLPTTSSIFLVFFPLSLCLARLFWPDLMNGRHDHATAVCISLRWSGGLPVVRLPAGSWHGLPHW